MRQGAVRKVVAVPCDIGETGCVHGEYLRCGTAGLTALSEPSYDLLDVLKLLGLALHLAYAALGEKRGGDPKIGPFLEEDSFDLAAFEGAADGGRQDAESGR